MWTRTMELNHIPTTELSEGTLATPGFSISEKRTVRKISSLLLSAPSDLKT